MLEFGYSPSVCWFCFLFMPDDRRQRGVCGSCKYSKSSALTLRPWPRLGVARIRHVPRSYASSESRGYSSSPIVDAEALGEATAAGTAACAGPQASAYASSAFFCTHRAPDAPRRRCRLSYWRFATFRPCARILPALSADIVSILEAVSHFINSGSACEPRPSTQPLHVR